jgi:phospholipid-binding lipoprotein MlaA
MPTPKPAAALLACALVAACAAPPGRKPDPRDPFERVNRATFGFNEAVDRSIGKPVARGYRRFVPGVVRTGIRNFFSNLEMPGVALNDLLQGKLEPAAHDVGRFMLNATLGLGGFFDPASAAGLDRNDEDFGQTLGTWGLPVGAYLVVPIFGPSSLRDGIGSVADEYTDPSSYIEKDSLRYGLEVPKQIDRRARLLDAESVLGGAYDRYVLLRSAYLQRREYLVADGEVPEDEDEFLDPEEVLEEEGLEPPDGETAVEPSPKPESGEEAPPEEVPQPQSIP